jgi:tetratricopeptide (TPR) repeat protein
VLLLLDLYPLERLAGGARRALLEKLPFLAASLAVGWLTVVAQQRAGALAVEKLALLDRSLLAVRGAVFYLEQTLWPSGLVPFYPLPRARLIAPSLLCAAVLLGLVLIAGWRWRRGERWWLISLAAYVVLLLPVSGLLQAGSQAAADRFSYLPSLALFPLVGAALLRLFELSAGWSRGARWALRLAPLALAALLALRSTEQLAIWRDSESFWTHVARSFPGQVSQAHNNLGVVYHRRGELARAASEYRRALLIFPDNPDAHNNLGLVLAIVGDYPEAERELELAIRLRPRHAEAHLNLAKLYLATGRRQAALRFLARAAELGAPPEQVAALARTIAGARRR